MKWKKLGLIFCPNNNYEWMISHAANPVAEYLEKDTFKIYFSCRDRKNRSSIGFIIINLNNPQQVIQISNQPVVQPGEIGTFDDSGVSMGCLTILDEKRYLYYLGWNLGVTVPWRNSIGLAISNSLQSGFKRFSKAPIVDRNEVDPLSISYPWVMRDGQVWKMWYGSNLKWGSQPTDMAYLIKYAESLDGINWIREGTIALNFKSPDEYAIAKPCVIKENGIYKMWYSYRGTAYRIGYAESLDGIHWERFDEKFCLNVSTSGWDSESVEYPFVFNYKDEKYMLYNGNGYGKSGFGLAILV